MSSTALVERALGEGADAAALLAAHRVVCRQLAAAEGEAADALAALADRLVREGCVARLAARERVEAALGRLADLGPITDVVDRGAAEAGEAAELDRVVLSRVREGELLAEAVFWRDDAAGAAAALDRLRAAPVVLAYPLIETEAVRRRRPLLVADAATDARGRAAHAATLAWSQFVVAPIMLDGRVAGFLHGDRARGVAALQRDVLWEFAQGFARVFERAVLRRRLRIQREEMRQVAGWAEARTSELSDRAVDLAIERSTGRGDAPAARAAGPDSELRDLLTRRELDVLHLMVEGETNAAIARALVVSEGTVKFHVKNILRKLRVANRAEATSRFLRLSQRQ